MTFEQVRSYMASSGWPIQPLRPTTFRTSYRGQHRTVSFFVHDESLFLVLAAVPYARLPADPALAQALMQQLLRWNREMNLAKFSVDDDGDVVLSIEYRLAHLGPQLLGETLDVLSFYADSLWPQVQALLGPSAGAQAS